MAKTKQHQITELKMELDELVCLYGTEEFEEMNSHYQREVRDRIWEVAHSLHALQPGKPVHGD
jgi:hypothetical protein